nr:UvrD-helicase domain-containing protein [uncultured Acetatifactor sp.]
MYIGDLHIHSRYSRATSKDCTPEHLDLWARKKGIHILGTGDFTHPAWREELKEKLEPAEDGLYVLKKEYRIGGAGDSGIQPRFVVTGEISSIYKKGDCVRKVHSLLILPGLEAAETLARRLELIGNIHSDGRPILGIPCRDLLEIMLETAPDAVYVPAHIWTPHFSLFGAFSGFDAIEECFEDLTPHIRALETGLSSDPPMNWRVAALDRFHLISNSDAHSPGKLGREANLFDMELSYPNLAGAIQEGKGLAGTIEFFPEEGKYHFDGHRKCGLCISPRETAGYGNKCPVCGKKITIGVLNRIEQLADREEGFVLPTGRPFESLVPLPEVIGASMGISAAGKKAAETYERMTGALGPEFAILREVPVEDIRKAAGPLVAEGIRRLREGKVKRTPGFDGEYGKIGLFSPEDISSLEGQMSFFTAEELQLMKKGSGKKQVPEAFDQQIETEKAEEIALRKPKSGTETEAIARREPESGTETEAIARRKPEPGTETEAITRRKPESGKETETIAQRTGEDAKTVIQNAETGKNAAIDLQKAGTANHAENGTQRADSLNQHQRDAVERVGRSVAVIAGPGAGKTRTLIARLCHLLDERGIAPEEITAVTFTNKAAEEMRARMEDESVVAKGRPGRLSENRRGRRTSDIQIGTFHAICSRFLQEAGLSFVVADEGLQMELAEKTLREFDGKEAPKKFLQELSKEKNGLYGNDAEPDDRKNPCMYQHYQKLLRQAGALDYDDLLLETMHLLEELPEDAPQRRPFSYLLIDEFQDVNPLQYRLVREWSRGGRELFVIGDPDQSIYGFRGCDPKVFSRLEEERPDLVTIRLEENYRCAPSILNAALGVISHNTGQARRMKAMAGYAEHGECIPGLPVRMVSAEDERREAIFVAKEITRQIGGIDMLDTDQRGAGENRAVRGFSDMAVLYRTHRQAALLEKCLRQEGIPYLVAGREDFLQEREARAALYFFRHVLYPNEEATEALCRRLLGPVLGEGREEGIELLVEKYRKKVRKSRPVKLLEEWSGDVRPENPDTMKKLTDMSVLYPTMENFLQTLSFGEDGDVRRNGGRKFTADAVTLMTLHGSKGLEFPVVFLYGMDRGRFPLEFGGGDADMEEERRLCYVGMTRAREELILVSGKESSPFLQELPTECVSQEQAEKEEEVQAVQMSLFDLM